MGENSHISWTQNTWNIARGCKKVDSDCKNCYMYRDSFDGSRYNPKEITRTKGVFNLPLKIKEPSLIFTCSLTDFFIEEIDSYRDEAWEIIRKCPHHTFQVLTKRTERLPEQLPADWGDGYDNVWLGTSVGSNGGKERINELMKVKAKVYFVSFEPLHEHIDLSYFSDEVLSMIDWAILGGESGNDTGLSKYRPCQIHWMEDMAEKLKKQGTAIFIKQMGTYLSKQLKMSDRHGTKIEDFPESLKIREFPSAYKIP